MSTIFVPNADEATREKIHSYITGNQLYGTEDHQIRIEYVVEGKQLRSARRNGAHGVGVFTQGYGALSGGMSNVLRGDGVLVLTSVPPGFDCLDMVFKLKEEEPFSLIAKRIESHLSQVTAREAIPTDGAAYTKSDGLF